MYLCISELFKTGLDFLLHNNLLNLCSHVVNSQRLFFCKVLNGSIKAFRYTKCFLLYRYNFFFPATETNSGSTTIKDDVLLDGW